MKGIDDENLVLFKYACALNKLLNANKKKHEKNKKMGIEDIMLNHSYDKISADTGLRNATINNIFNGLSDAKISSIDLILKSLGVSNSKFGKIIDGLTQDEIIEYSKKKKKITNKA